MDAQEKMTTQQELTVESLRPLSPAQEERVARLKRETLFFNACETNRAQRVTHDIFQGMIESGLNASLTSVFANEGLVGSLDEIEYWYQNIEGEFSPYLIKATTTADVEQARAEGKIAVFFGAQNCEPFGDNLNLLRTFYRLGMRAFTLTYQRQNLVGSGCAEERDAGLTMFGRKVVELMNDLGIIIDLSHPGYRTSMDAMEMSEAPVIYSHSGAYEVFPHPRNVRDDQLDALAESGGVIGVPGATPIIKKLEFEGDGSTLDDMLDHIDYIVKRIGVDHVGIGLDVAPTLTREIFVKEKAKPGIHHPLQVYETWWAKGMHTTDKWGNMIHGLVSRGYTDEDVAKIMGLNFMRVFKRVLG